MRDVIHHIRLLLNEIIRFRILEKTGFRDFLSLVKQAITIRWMQLWKKCAGTDYLLLKYWISFFILFWKMIN